MGDPVGAEEGNNSSWKERGASSEIAWNKWMRQKRAGGMMRSVRSEVILCVCPRGCGVTAWSVCRGSQFDGPSAGHSPGCSKMMLTPLQCRGPLSRFPGALRLDT